VEVPALVSLVNVALRLRQKYFTPLGCAAGGRGGSASPRFTARQTNQEVHPGPNCIHETIYASNPNHDQRGLRGLTVP